jgi:hypothetical protein
MSGILDKKSRILDAILTSEGRRQMSEGTYNVSYVTFSDYGVSYIPDSENGHEDPTDKIYFEACNLPQDQITFEANDSGRLVVNRQNIKVNYSDSFLTSSSALKANGILENGMLSVFGYVNGRTVKVTGKLLQVNSDKDKGFIYEDSLGVTGSILVDPQINGGQIYSGSASSKKIYIGTRNGVDAAVFAKSIASSIQILSSSGGPNVSAYSLGDTVYLDSDKNALNLSLIASGTLSTPLYLKKASVGNTLLRDDIINANFASSIEGILTSSFDNFLELQTISTLNRLFEDDQFVLSTNEVNFDFKNCITPEAAATLREPAPVNSIDSIFSDEKTSHLDNFLYLPPIVKASDAEIPDKSDIESTANYRLGSGSMSYPSWGDNEKKLTYSKLSEEINQFPSSKSVIKFTKTSLNNNLIGQFFEITNKEVNKLDVINFGDVMDDAQEETSVTKKVFFVGKTFLDDNGTVCFVNMFTLIFERDSSTESS